MAVIFIINSLNENFQAIMIMTTDMIRLLGKTGHLN